MYRQKALFDMIKSRLSSNLRLVDIVCDTLDISTDAAYRRIRCKKELTLVESAKLCNAYDISMDSILNYKSNYASFRYTPLEMSNFDVYCNYIEGLASLYDGLIHAEEKSIITTAQDILIFHFLPFTELTLFKLYVWNQSTSGQSLISYERFATSIDRNRLEGIYKKIIRAYNLIPSTELWTSDTINDIIASIEYHYDLDCFENKETINLICHQLLQLIENVCKLAETGIKEYNEKKTMFNMYLCPVHMENNFLITNNNGTKTTSIKLYTINGIITSNTLFCDETEKWIHNLISKSINFTGASERERFKFFQMLRNKVNYLTDKINNT